VDSALSVGSAPLTAWTFLAKKQRVADGVKILLDVAKESSDWFPPLKSALGGVTALIKHYEVLVERLAVVHN
jgi:hypothetical protein